MHKLLINFAAFQIGWFSCVLGAANGYPLLGPVVTALVVGLHLAMAQQPRSEIILLLIAALIGLIFDSILVQTGWLSYPSGMILEGIAPYWIITMWVLFATTLNVSMKWMHGNYLAAAALGFIGGPMSYYGGFKLGGLVFVNLPYALAALAVGWAVIMPALIWLAARVENTDAAQTEVQYV